MDGLFGLLPLIFIVALFYLVILRPQRNRQRKLSAVQQDLAPGREVMMSAGLYGIVRGVEGDIVVLETSPGVTSRWSRAAVVKVVTQLDDTDGTNAGGPADAGIVLKKRSPAPSRRQPPAGTTSG